MSVRLQELVIDCHDPARLARFWGELLGVRWVAMDPEWAVVDSSPLQLAFQWVPEAKGSPKNRLHLDIEVPDAEAAVARALALGAEEAGHRQLDPEGEGFVVLRDPEANEFCFVIDNSGSWRAGIQAALDAADPP